MARNGSSRPALEMADIVRAGGAKLPRAEFALSHLVTGKSASGDRTHCRTAALGGHRDRCVDCDRRAFSFNSCRNRHCPKCQANSRIRWLEARRQELLPVRYVACRLHPAAVSGSPGTAEPEAHLPSAVSGQCRDTAGGSPEPATPGRRNRLLQRPSHLESEAGAFIPMSTASSPLAVSDSRPPAVDPPSLLLLPSGRGACARCSVASSSQALKRAHRRGELEFHGKLQHLARRTKHSPPGCDRCFTCDWVAYVKPPFGGPEHALRYLGGYTHRIAISNHRLVSFADGQVTFCWRDRAHKNKKRLLIPAGRGVPTALPVARRAAGLCSHPLLRLSRQPSSPSPASPVPAIARRPTGDSGNTTHSQSTACDLALPTLWWCDGRRGAAIRRGTPSSIFRREGHR